METKNEHDVFGHSWTAPPAPPPNSSDYSLQDYETQLLLLEQQNIKRLFTHTQKEVEVCPADGDLDSKGEDLGMQSLAVSSRSHVVASMDPTDQIGLGTVQTGRTIFTAAETDTSDRRAPSSPSASPRKPIPISSIDPRGDALVQETPSWSVHVQTPLGNHQQEPSSVLIEDHASQRSSLRSPSPLRRQLASDTAAQSGASFSDARRGGSGTHAPMATSYVNVAALDRTVGSLPDAPESGPAPTSSLPHGLQAFEGPATPKTGSHISYHDSHHHHTLSGGRSRPPGSGDRASKVVTRSRNSDGSSNSEANTRNDFLAPSNIRLPSKGALSPPQSVRSSTSDILNSRNRSPQRSMQGYTRASSLHSATPPPDQRQLSYVDLLNVPYPQPLPISADHLGNAQLRSAVGNNAALLSTRRTLEMYRANVKKTNEPAVQYEFAVFMISAAEELPIEPENGSPSGGTTHADLLKEARQILQKLSDRSYPFAQYYLADGYSSGLFSKGKEDYEKAFPLFVSASKHGHAEAGYRAALCYEFGWGCRVDGAKAMQFFRQAASKNHPGAMLRVGRACLVGDMGQTKRYREGGKWLKRAVESADFQYNSAPYELGLLHETGYGDDIFRDECYAAQLFTKSADLGHAEANYRLGAAYEHGTLGCPPDPALSVHFYTGAAQQSHPLAMMALCAWYMVGAEPVLEKDENEAYEWARKAAGTGLARAEYTVGFFTETGIGCRRDALEANVWYVRAADQGDEKAIHRIAAIRSAATGANPLTAALPKDESEKLQQSKSPAGTERGQLMYPSQQRGELTKEFR